MLERWKRTHFSAFEETGVKETLRYPCNIAIGRKLRVDHPVKTNQSNSKVNLMRLLIHNNIRTTREV